MRYLRNDSSIKSSRLYNRRTGETVYRVKESVIIEMGVTEIRFWKVSMARNTVEVVKKYVRSQHKN